MKTLHDLNSRTLIRLDCWLAWLTRPRAMWRWIRYARKLRARGEPVPPFEKWIRKPPYPHCYACDDERWGLDGKGNVGPCIVCNRDERYPFWGRKSA